MPSNFRLDTKVLDEIIRNTPEQCDKLLRAAAEGIVNDIKVSFNTSPAGRTYGGHVASQPGYPPNVDTGALRASMNWQAEGDLRYVVSDGVEYGYWLEEGTDKMQPRPFVQPVFREWRRTRFVRLARNMGIVKGS